MNDAPPPPPELRARVLSAAKRAPSPARPAVRRADALGALLGVGALVVVFAALGGVDTTTRPRAFLVMTAVGWGAIAALATWLGVGRGGSMLGRKTPLLAASALATAPALFAWMQLGTSMWPVALGFPGGVSTDLACFAATLAMGAGPFLALLVARRASDPIHPRAAAAALGAASAAWGSVMIDLHCPISDASHVLFGHVLPVALFALAGAALGTRVLRVRSVGGA